jgi:hypothetical protein
MMFPVAKLPFPRGSGSDSPKQWAAGAPVIGAAPVSSGRPKRPRADGLPASGALQLFSGKENDKGRNATENKRGPDIPVAKDNYIRAQLL